MSLQSTGQTRAANGGKLKSDAAHPPEAGFDPTHATETTVCDRCPGTSCEAVGAQPAMRIIALLGLWLCLQGCSLENYAGPTAPISADLDAADDAVCRSFGLVKLRLRPLSTNARTKNGP